MTYEQLCDAFAQLYPTEFAHVQAVVRIHELEQELEELRGTPED